MHNFLSHRKGFETIQEIQGKKEWSMTAEGKRVGVRRADYLLESFTSLTYAFMLCGIEIHWAYVIENEYCDSVERASLWKWPEKKKCEIGSSAFCPYWVLFLSPSASPPPPPFFAYAIAEFQKLTYPHPTE